MKLRGLVDYDICNYRSPSMFLIFPYCSFKCDKEFGTTICQNSDLVSEPIIEVNTRDIIARYLNNPLSHALVCGGLEPMDSFDELNDLISSFRQVSKDTIIIYTGYKEEEIQNYISVLKKYDNLIIKFGRYDPNNKSKYDTNLGKILSSRNQYSKMYLNGKEIDSRCFN